MKNKRKKKGNLLNISRRGQLNRSKDPPSILNSIADHVASTMHTPTPSPPIKYIYNTISLAPIKTNPPTYTSLQYSIIYTHIYIYYLYTYILYTSLHTIILTHLFLPIAFRKPSHHLILSHLH